MDATRSVTSEVAVGAIVVAPLFVGLVAHGLCIRFGLLRSVAVSINPRLFGANKTYRGVVAVALGTAAGFAAVRPPELLAPVASSYRFALVGLAVGAVAMLAELPNSFLKRRMGIAPGNQARGLSGIAFHVLDQVDVVFGAWLVLGWLLKPTWLRLAGSFAAVYVGHQIISLIGYWLGMRTTPR
jgi:CDP-diacylglycerol--serine O-phosphatidyltransferase